MFSLQIIGNPRFVPGYLEDFRQPLVMFRLLVSGGSSREALVALLNDVGAELGLPVGEIQVTPQFVLNQVLAWTSGLLEKHNHPICQPGKVVVFGKDKNSWLLMQPCVNPKAAGRALQGIVNLLMGSVDVGIELDNIRKVLDSTQLQGFNQFHFIKTAHNLNVPWEILPGGVLLLGWGKNARWLESSITDSTSAIGTQYARHKFRAASLLSHAGLPVPAHVLLRDGDKLQAAVDVLGFPLVVKPADKDGGVGVKANLQTFDQVRKAFNEAKTISSDVLIERHVPGRDYRVQVVEDEVQGVLERTPGGVVGNGSTSVRELVIAQNAERASAEDDRRYLHPIEMDDEAAEQLQAQGLDWQAVPAEGLFIRLRGACNVASGGVPREIPLDQVHKDNLLLARNAARALRLDVAGIDLLLPDIGQSWLDTGAHICEINAQPQMFTTMHGPMVKKLLNGGDGRVPVVAVVSRSRARPQWLNALVAALANKGICLGTAAGGEVWVGEHCVNKSVQDLYGAVKMLCFNTRVEAMLFVMSDGFLFQNGWPVDRCTLLVIDDDEGADPARRNESFRLTIQNAKAVGPKWIISNNRADAPSLNGATAVPRFQYCPMPERSQGAEIVGLISRLLSGDVGDV